MSTVAFIRRCLAAGMDMETALIAAEAFEESAPVYVPAQSKGAQRTAKWRAKKGSPSVTVTVCDAGDEQASPEPSPTCAGKSLSASSLRSEAYPPERPTVSTPRGSDKRGTRLPDDWRPDADGWTYAVQLLDSEPAAQAQLERFRDYWRAIAGAKGRKLDWPATWRNWCRTASENSARKAHERPHPNGKLARKEANLARAFAGSERASGPRWEP